MAAWRDGFDADWGRAKSVQERAALLQSLGSRAAQLCAVVAQVREIPPEAAGFHSQLGDAVRARHEWVEAAAQQLRCCGADVSNELEAGNRDSSAKAASAVATLGDIEGLYGASPVGGLSVSEPVTGVDLSLPAGWLSLTDGLSLVALAGPSEQGIGLMGLGPATWWQGTAVRIRRLRNSGPLSVTEASERFNALVTRHGPVTFIADTEIDGHDALTHSIAVDDWEATVTVVVAGDFTYFIETGCPKDMAAACDAVDEVTASIRLAR